MLYFNSILLPTSKITLLNTLHLLLQTYSSCHFTFLFVKKVSCRFPFPIKTKTDNKGFIDTAKLLTPLFIKTNYVNECSNYHIFLVHWLRRSDLSRQNHRGTRQPSEKIPSQLGEL